jgi:predicted Zn-dependent peptidase
MTTIRLLLPLLLALPLHASNTLRCITDTTDAWIVNRLKGDPNGTVYYTLKNGFTLIVSPDRNTPRFYSCVAVRAGGKDDPQTNTGLAHYLEHMLFKGTDRLGTINYEKEAGLLEFIENLYEKYNKTKDPLKRAKLYGMIDSVSLLASKYSIANEYDKLMQQMGVTGTNAFTDFDETVYINDVPSIQLEKFINVEFERFRKPVLRLFHTELEAVYEEKNISMDADGFKAYESMMASLFKKHTYGTQTVIGKAEHLKNPSLKEIRSFYEKHYQPGNMALIIAGNVNPEKVAELTAKTFGTLPAMPLPQKKVMAEEPEITKPEIKTVYGQESPFVLIGFRLPSIYKTNLSERFYLIEQLLGNEQTGLIRKNLLLPQKLLSARAEIYRLSDYSVLMLEGRPLAGQSLEEVKNLLLSQIDSLKKNLAKQEMFNAIISNLELKRMLESEENLSRAFRLLENYIHDEDLSLMVAEIERMKKIKPLEISLLSRNYLKNNYAVVFKQQGTDTTVKKIDKPKISAVNLNRDKFSKFAKEVMNASAPNPQPKFLNFNTDIVSSKLQSGVMLNYVRNTENRRFELEIVFEKGSIADPELPIIYRYLQLAGSEKFDMNYLNGELYKLACDVSFSTDEFETRVKLSGNAGNLERALSILEYFISNPAADQKILEKLIATIMREREDQLTDRETLNEALSAYAIYGKKNPFNTVLSNKELKNLNAQQLVKKIRNMNQFPHQLYYYGPQSSSELTNLLNKYHTFAVQFKSEPVVYPFKPLTPEKRQLVYYPYEMLQADIGWLGATRNFSYDSSAFYNLFNEYFGGGMASIVFQTIRESRALAYSCNGVFRVPAYSVKPSFFNAYIGTQADKADSAIQTMQYLLTNMPVLNEQFEAARISRIKTISNNWIRKSEINGYYRLLKNRGQLEDPRKVELLKLDKIIMADIKNLQQNKLASEKFAMYVLADPKKLKPEALSRYGSVKIPDRKELFGY